MEQKFQTSFIPKKQNLSQVSGVISNGTVKKAKSTTTESIFMFVAVIIFVISVAGIAGAYFWKSYLTSTNELFKKELATREGQFQIETIEKLKAINFQIDSAKKILKSHIAVSRVFDIVQKLAVDNVRFTSMDFKGGSVDSGDITLNIKGYGKDLPSIAFQSDILGQLSDYGLGKVIKSPILSNPTTNANGTVSFELSARIDANALSYEKSVNDDPIASP